MPYSSHPLAPEGASRGRLALDQAALTEWGRRFGAAAKPPLVVTIAGEIGTGKTTLVQAICSGYGVAEPVTSPTFALVHEYSAPRSPVLHLDLYRLERQSELESLGWDELMQTHALILVEWPERADGMLPPDRVQLALEYADGNPESRVLLAG